MTDSICNKCINRNECKMREPTANVGACYCYEYDPRFTNAERIRAMSDEELAEFLIQNRGGCRALTTESYVCDFYKDDLNTDCKSCWLDWLKQEATE